MEGAAMADKVHKVGYDEGDEEEEWGEHGEYKRLSEDDHDTTVKVDVIYEGDTSGTRIYTLLLEDQKSRLENVALDVFVYPDGHVRVRQIDLSDLNHREWRTPKRPKSEAT